MRTLPLRLLPPGLLACAALALAGAPAAAQVQQGNPNAANEALSAQGQARAAQQGRTTQGDMTRMNAERSQMAAPPPAVGPSPVAAPRR